MQQWQKQEAPTSTSRGSSRKDGGIAKEDFGNLLDAYDNQVEYDLVEVTANGFMLGYIYGKRAERARRKKMHQDVDGFSAV